MTGNLGEVRPDRYAGLTAGGPHGPSVGPWHSGGRGRVLSKARPVPVCAIAGPSVVCDGRTGRGESRGQRPRRKLEQGLGGKGGACTRAGAAGVEWGHDIKKSKRFGWGGEGRTRDSPGSWPQVT